jgi:hypothetical protein
MYLVYILFNGSAYQYTRFIRVLNRHTFLRIRVALVNWLSLSEIQYIFVKRKSQIKVKSVQLT